MSSAFLPGTPPGITEIVGCIDQITGSLDGSLHHLVPLEYTAARVFQQRRPVPKPANAGRPLDSEGRRENAPVGSLVYVKPHAYPKRL